MASLRKIKNEVRALNERAYERFRANDIEEFERVTLNAAEMALDGLPAEDLDRAIVLNNLGALRLMEERTEEARCLHEEALVVRSIRLDPSDPAIAESLRNLGHVEAQVPDWSKACRYYEEALALRESAYGSSDMSVAESLYDLGCALGNDGQLERGIELLYRALEIEQRLLGVASENAMETALSLGRMLRASRHFDDAVRVYASQIAEIDDDESTGTVLYEELVDGLAETLEALGEYARAADVMKRLVNRMRRQNRRETRSYRAALHNLSQELRVSGQIYEAMEILGECIAIARKEPSSDASELARVISLRGQLETGSGDLKSAEATFREALDLAREGSNDGALLGHILNELAGVMRSRGEFAQAVRMWRESKQRLLEAAGPKDLSYGVAANNLGALHIFLGDHASAERELLEGLEVREACLGDIHPDLAQSHLNLSSCYRLTGDVRSEQAHLFQAITILRESGSVNGESMVQALFRASEFYALTGNPLAALGSAIEALEVAQSALGAEHYRTGAVRLQVGQRLFDLGRMEEAKSHVLSGLEILGTAIGNFENELAAGHLLKARIEVTLGDFENARHSLASMEQIDDSIIGDVFAAVTEEQRLTFLGQLRGRFDGYFSVFAATNAGNTFEQEKRAFEFALRRKGISAEAAIAQRQCVGSPVYERLRQVRGQAAYLTMASRRHVENDRLPKELADLQRLRVQLESELVEELNKAGLGIGTRPIDSEDLCNRLVEGVRLVEFVRVSLQDFNVAACGNVDHYLAFTLDAREATSLRFVDLGEADSIDESISSFRWLISHSESEKHLDAISQLQRELGAVLLDPLLEEFSNGRLLLSPDAQLSTLPFGLLTLRDGSMLLEKCQVDYICAARDVLPLTQSQPSAGKAVVVGDPDFDHDFCGADSPREFADPAAPHALRGCIQRFGRLPETRREANEIAAMMGVDPILGTYASKRTVKNVDRPCVLHIAAHGFFVPGRKPHTLISIPWLDEPGSESFSAAMSMESSPLLRSGIALAGANAWLNRNDAEVATVDDSGILTADELATLNLSGTQLAVLSACDTGLGDPSVGEGVLGLRRALRFAGTASLVVSLWKVPDDATRRLMVEFYQGLKRGEQAGSALRSAQLRLASELGSGGMRSWGGFVLEGHATTVIVRDASLSELPAD